LFATGLALVLASWQMLWLAGAGATVLLGLWALALRRHDAFATPRTERAHGAHQPAPAPELIAAASIFLLWSMQYFAYMTWLPNIWSRSWA
jgi:hypothetical protein